MLPKYQSYVSFTKDILDLLKMMRGVSLISKYNLS